MNYFMLDKNKKEKVLAKCHTYIINSFYKIFNRGSDKFIIIDYKKWLSKVQSEKCKKKKKKKIVEKVIK
jgi:hypothetical protein